MLVHLIDDSNQFGKDLGRGIQHWIDELGLSAKFEHTNPNNVFNSKTCMDDMKPSFQEIIEDAKSRASKIIILSDATFITNLAYELQVLPYPKRLGLFQEEGKSIYLGVLSGSTEQQAVDETREYKGLIKQVRSDTGLVIPWILKPVNPQDILELKPWVK